MGLCDGLRLCGCPPCYCEHGSISHVLPRPLTPRKLVLLCFQLSSCRTDYQPRLQSGAEPQSRTIALCCRGFPPDNSPIGTHICEARPKFGELLGIPTWWADYRFQRYQCPQRLFQVADMQQQGKDPLDRLLQEVQCNLQRYPAFLLNLWKCRISQFLLNLSW